MQTFCWNYYSCVYPNTQMNNTSFLFFIRNVNLNFIQKANPEANEDFGGGFFGCVFITLRKWGLWEIFGQEGKIIGACIWHYRSASLLHCCGLFFPLEPVSCKNYWLHTQGSSSFLRMAGKGRSRRISSPVYFPLQVRETQKEELLWKQQDNRQPDVLSK